MANEIFKELKTRIALKQNTYEYWMSGEGKDYIPLYGEICLCEIPAPEANVEQQTNGAQHATNAPTVLFKVGTAKKNEDGSWVEGTAKKFSELNWVSALAADVYAWAKAPTKPEYQAKEIKELGDFIAEYVDETLGITVDTNTVYRLVKVDDFNYKLQSKAAGETEEAWADVADSVIAIPEGAKYDLSAKVENEETVLSLAGTDNTEDNVAFVGDDSVSVSVENGKIKISAHDTKYTGGTTDDITVTATDDGEITALINDEAIATKHIIDGAVTLEKLAEELQTALEYIDTDGSVSKAIEDAVAELSEEGGAINAIVKDNGTIDNKISEALSNLSDAGTYVKESGFEDRVKGIKVTNAVNADEATHAANADEATHATNADAATHATAAGKVDTSITVRVGGADVVFDGSEAKTADVDAAIAAAIAEIPEPVDYTVTCADVDYEATEDAPAFKRHTLTQNGKQVCVIDVPRDLVIKSGSVDKENNELVLVLVNDEEIRVDVSHLIEYVTGGTAADGVITVSVSDDFVATATINDGTITEAKLHKDVTDKLNKTWEEVGVAKELVDALAGEGNTTTVAAIDERVGNLENAGHLTEITTTANNGLKVTNKNNIDIDEDVIFVLNCNW